MLQVQLNDRPYQMPETWNELTAGQLTRIAPLLLQKEVSNAERWFIVWQLCGFGKRLFNRFANRAANGYDYLSSQFIAELFPRIEWLFKKNNLTKNLLPVIEVPRRFSFFGTTRLYGPADNFDNLTIGEFSDCEACLDQWERTKDALWLNRFIGILYRPRLKGLDKTAADYKGDERQPYNFHLNDFLAAMADKLDDRTKSAILLWYMGCRAELTQCFPYIFDKSKAAKEGGTGNWVEVIHALAGPKFGTIAQTEKANLKIVFTELTVMQKQAAEINKHG